MKKYLKGKWGIASIVFGALMFALAFVPCLVVKTFLGTESRNLYHSLESIFESGFGEGFGAVLMSIGTLLYFIAAIYAIVVGVLMLIKVIKDEKLDFIGYAVGFIGSLFVLIGFLAADLPSQVTTFSYIPLIVISLVALYKGYELIKK